MKRRATKSKLIILSLLLALGAVSFAATRIRSIRTAWRVSNSRPDNSETIKLHVRSLCEEAYHYRAAGRYAEAAAPLSKALALAEESLGLEDVEVASVLNQLGMLDKYAGRFDEGERAYRRALAILERAYGPEDPRLADIFHNLGGLAHARGRYEAGEPLARRGLEMRERAPGRDDRDVAADVAALAAILDGEGRRDEAERLYLRALAIFEHALDPSHPSVVACRENLARLLKR